MTTTSIGDPRAPEANGTARAPGSPRTPRTSDLLVGRLLDGRYQIVERLARGGMATVYQAVDTRLTRTVAVKVMHVGLGDDVSFARKFDREARAAARLSHPNVVSVFDQGSDTLDDHVSRPYIVMEYVDGETLRDVINRESPMTPTRALEVIEPILAALASAHDAGLVHRDVKPENVLISGRGQIKVADFGLAKAISAQTSTATQGMLIGTVSYLPPELVVSGKADARSDVYSAGVVLFELLTGQKPHTGETPIQVAYAHVHRDVPAPSSFPTAGALPPYVDALVARATAREPDVRPHDARVLLSHVRRVRSALRQGLVDDPELTQDLRPGFPPEQGEPDSADFEVTELVDTVPPVGSTRVSVTSVPAPLWRAPSAQTPDPRDRDARFTPPTVLDAPPPVALPLATQDRLDRRRTLRTRKRRRGWIALLLVLMLTAAAALAGWYVTAGRFTSAPVLTSLSRTDAEQTATGAGLQVAFTDDYSEDTAAGKVMSTDPEPGAKILRGGQIEAVVSRGPERVSMPTVTGLSQDVATTTLSQSGLKVGRIGQSWSETVAAGLVLKAGKNVGTSLKRGSKIDLTLSGGPKPVPIKSYAGKDVKNAVAALKKAGFRVAQKSVTSTQVARGSVVTQSPDSGAGRTGDQISLTVSSGPPLVTVPNVSRMGTKAAKQVLRDAGFKTKVKPVAVNYIGIGYVVYTNPRARTSAPKGSTITLYVV